MLLEGTYAASTFSCSSALRLPSPLKYCMQSFDDHMFGLHSITMYIQSLHTFVATYTGNTPMEPRIRTGGTLRAAARAARAAGPTYASRRARGRARRDGARCTVGLLARIKKCVRVCSSSSLVVIVFPIFSPLEVILQPFRPKNRIPHP